MDKNTVTGLVLMCLVIFGFMWLSKPSEAELAQQRQQDSIARVEQEAREKAMASTKAQTTDTLTSVETQLLEKTLTELAADTGVNKATGIENGAVRLSIKGGKIEGSVTVGDTTLSAQEVLATSSSIPALHNQAVAAVKDALVKYAGNGAFAGHLTGKNETVTLRNNVLQVDISTKGGTIERARLLKYNAFNDSTGVNVIDDNNSFNFTLSNNTQRFDTRNFYFTPTIINDSTVLMNMDLGGGSNWGIRYTLVPGDEYMLRIDIVQSGMRNIIPTNISSIDLEWKQKMARHEAGKYFEERNSALYYKFNGADGDVKHLKEAGTDEKEIQEELKWISTKNQFFSAVLIANGHFDSATLESSAIEKESSDYENYLKNMSIRTSLPYVSTDEVPVKLMFYLGPNKYRLLSSYDKYSPQQDLKLTKLIPLGYNWFRWINTGIVIPVFDWLSKYIASYGIIILLLTILIKIVLAPLTFKSYMSQAKMRVLQPDVQAINEKYPGQDNAMKRQQKTMELYNQAGANPMGGCLPMLLQMPILIAMFWFFPSCIELRGESFLWAKDLSAPDAIISWNVQIPFISNYFGNHISLFCLLMTVTNIVYTYISMQSQAQSQQMAGMKWMMYLMPLMFLVFFNNYASGLSYYYFVSLLITIAQTYACRFLVDEKKIRAKMAENAKKPKKKSGFMARLEEAQRQQQAALREQQKQNNRKKRR